MSFSELWRQELYSILKIQHIGVLDSNEMAHTGFSTPFLVMPSILLAVLAVAAHFTHEFREITPVTSRCTSYAVTASSQFTVMYSRLDIFLKYTPLNLSTLKLIFHVFAPICKVLLDLPSTAQRLTVWHS